MGRGRESALILNKLSGVIGIAAGAVIAVGPWTFARVCTDMPGDAACHTTRLYALALGVVILLLGIIQCMVKSRLAGKFISALYVIAGVIGLLIPLVLAPVCSETGMACRTKTLPVLLITSIALLLLSLGFLMIGGKKKEKPEKPVTAPAPAAETAVPAAPVQPAPVVQDSPFTQPVQEVEAAPFEYQEAAPQMSFDAPPIYTEADPMDTFKPMDDQGAE